jgi:truncated hemoglobin YjbI
MPKKKTIKSKKSIKETKPVKQEINITPEQYKAWIQEFANTITDTLMAEIVKMKTAGKKKKIDV